MGKGSAHDKDKKRIAYTFTLNINKKDDKELIEFLSERSTTQTVKEALRMFKKNEEGEKLLLQKLINQLQQQQVIQPVLQQQMVHQPYQPMPNQQMYAQGYPMQQPYPAYPTQGIMMYQQPMPPQTEAPRDYTEEEQKVLNDADNSLEDLMKAYD